MKIRVEPALGELRAKVFRGLADPGRIAIVSSLVAGRRNVGEIVELTGLSQPTVSAQLACLYECGLVRREQDGRFVFYELAAADVHALLERVDALLRRAAEQIAACVSYGEVGRHDGRAQARASDLLRRRRSAAPRLRPSRRRIGAA